jgi:hypothetical protein
LKRLNYGTIVLIPKVQEVVTIKQFRQICLLNIFYKMFTKVLASRLMEVVGDIISETQTTFIKGRNILEGVLVLHEVIHELQVKHVSGILLKIDFEKVYDKVNWEFMKEVLVLKGFPGRWCDWVMQAVEGAKVCINVNSEQGRFFGTSKGLRQGASFPLAFRPGCGCSSSYIGCREK